MKQTLTILSYAVASYAMKDVTTTPINQWPMIMTHDAATTYLKGGFGHIINNWAKT